jgi:hypothetical protein
MVSIGMCLVAENQHAGRFVGAVLEIEEAASVVSDETPAASASVCLAVVFLEFHFDWRVIGVEVRNSEPQSLHDPRIGELALRLEE